MTKSPRSAGILLAILPLVGAVIGGLRGQPSIGLIAGFAAGLALVLLFWWRDQARP